MGNKPRFSLTYCPKPAIASEDQLDESGVDSLFLFVIDLDQAPADATGAMTVRNVADRLRQHLFSLDPGAADVFDTLLSAAGIRPEDDYSNSHWLEGSSRLYLVTGEFPRIARTAVRSGVSHVRYAISLGDCEPFTTSESALAEALTEMGGIHGN